MSHPLRRDWRKTLIFKLALPLDRCHCNVRENRPDLSPARGNLPSSGHTLALALAMQRSSKVNPFGAQHFSHVIARKLKRARDRLHLSRPFTGYERSLIGPLWDDAEPFCFSLNIPRSCFHAIFVLNPMKNDVAPPGMHRPRLNVRGGLRTACVNPCAFSPFRWHRREGQFRTWFLLNPPTYHRYATGGTLRDRPRKTGGRHRLCRNEPVS